MILQSLVAYYEALVRKGELAQPGWSPVKVSYALILDDEGAITNFQYLKVQDQSGKKMVPQILSVPTPVKRSSGVNPNFLCDNSSYLLGIDAKGKPERSEECFKACSKLHHDLLDNCDEPAARALLRFFDTWKPEDLSKIVTDENTRQDILNGANLIMFYNGEYLSENPAVRQCWQKYYAASEGDPMPCLITGQMAVPAKLHPPIKGIYGAQSSGASLVSFNAPAFCSYGHEQGYNAPTSEYAAFAYGTALNHLISEQHTHIGDTTVLFWAETAEEQYQTIWDFCCFGDVKKNYKEEDLKGAVQSICAGRSVIFDNTRIDPDMSFYLLGLAPNSARLSVRFFLRNSFGTFLRNIQAHYDRLEIVHSDLDRFDTIPIWKLLSETVNQNARDKTPAPGMAGETLRAILNNTPYPATLLNGVNLRIRADREINRTRAAIIKAYYLKKPHPDIPKEVLQVSLNPDCNDEAYVLGRVFSVLESIQDKANPGINTTIRDKYFSSASATPAVVFPTLISLAQKHLRKLDTGIKIYWDKQLTDLLGKLGESYPTHFSLPQQGAFQLGYYHENEARFTKKEDKENV